jgi:hypothetical protein
MTKTGWTALLALATAGAASAAGDELPAFRRALPERYFECSADGDCAMVQGWCATFAINKAALEAYRQMPPDPAGRGAKNCPPGWLPALPRAVCVSQRCMVVSGRP